MLAGTDTTSHYLEMMIYLIVRHPEVEKKVRKEIETYMQADDYSFDNLKNFTYIEKVQKEVSRIYGPAQGLFIRKATQDHLFCGVRMQKGTLLDVMVGGNHYNEKYFKDAKKFRPERWEG